MKLIEGKPIADKVHAETKQRVAALKKKKIVPGLAVVLVGKDPASTTYVRAKARQCEKLGIHSQKIELAEDTTQKELLDVVRKLNKDKAIHGILVQSPPPPQIDEAEIVQTINPDKDVDGFHPINVAKLAMEDPTGFVPCTPLGCMRLLEEYEIETEGANAVVVGRSMIVGKPLALLLMRNAPGGNATVTVAHSRTKDLADITWHADIVIAAVGKPNFLGKEHIREGTTLIDVGVNRLDDPEAKRGYRLVGDVDFEAVSEKAGAITPVPGGVGPMTIAMLMSNTLTACERLTA